MINSLLDDVLDRTVVAGFTNVGYRIRSRGWSASELQRMQGKVVLVTGASSGLGLAAAEGFARLGATVWLVVRSPERGEQARARIVERSGNGDVHVGVCDLSELESVRQFAGRFRDQASRLDVLVNNAGVMTEARGVSADGIELTLATNVVGPFLLTNLLIPLLQESAPARIINVSSGGMYTQKLRVDDLQSERGRVRRAEGVRAHQARGGDPYRALGRAVGGHRGRGPRDAPGVGGHPRRAILAASLLQADTTAAQDAGAGRRHDRLARCRRRTGPQLRPVLARPPTASHAPAAIDTGDAAGARAAARRVRTAQRLARRVRSDRVDFNSRRRIVMAHYRASIDIQQPREDVFAYLSDFSTTREWDPGVVEAERLNGQAVGEGTEFRLVAEFLGRKNELTYRIVEYDPPHAVTFLGENATVVSRDRITFESTAEGTRVTYDADLALKGLLRIADPLLALAFNRVGDRALAGLRRTLAPSQPQTLSPLSGRALDGKEYELPGDLAKQHNFLVVAFRREQQRVVDQWLPWLIDLEQRRSDVAVYELPVLSSVYGPARWFIDGGMTRGIPDAAARARTITVYTDVRKVVDNLGLAGTDTIAVLIVERSGRILASEVGGFEEQKAERLAASLAPTPSPTATVT